MLLDLFRGKRQVNVWVTHAVCKYSGAAEMPRTGALVAKLIESSMDRPTYSTHYHPQAKDAFTKQDGTLNTTMGDISSTLY